MDNDLSNLVGGYSFGMLLSSSSRNLTGLSEPSTAMIFLHLKTPNYLEARCCSISRIAFLSELHCSITDNREMFNIKDSPHVICSGI